MPVLDISNVIRAHERLLAETERAVDEAEELAGRHAEDHVKQYPPFKPRTGNLQASVGHKIVKVNGRILRVFDKAKYAAYIEYGTRPHEIRARRTRFLRFTVRGVVVFARKVNHPGTKPYKFLWRATYSAGRVLEQDLARRISDIASRF